MSLLSARVVLYCHHFVSSHTLLMLRASYSILLFQFLTIAFFHLYDRRNGRVTIVVGEYVFSGFSNSEKERQNKFYCVCYNLKISISESYKVISIATTLTHGHISVTIDLSAIFFSLFGLQSIKEQ